MNQARFFVDTAYVLALLNSRDAYHKKAKELLSQLRIAHEVWVTEAVLIEVGNSLALPQSPLLIVVMLLPM